MDSNQNPNQGGGDLLSMLMQDPAFADQMAALGVFPDRSKLLGQQFDLAHERAGTAMPKGMEVGGTYVAGNPLEFLASGIQRYRGEQGLQQAQAGQKSLIDDDVKNRGALSRAMAAALGGGGGSQAPASPGFVPAPQLY